MIVNRLSGLTAATFILTLSAAGLAAAQTPVTACGQVVDGNAVLTGDLDCSSYEDAAAIEIRSGTLDLAGYTLSGNESLEFCCFGGRREEEAAIWCSGKCSIVGPGTVIGGSFAVVSVSARALLSNVAVVAGPGPVASSGNNGVVGTQTERLKVVSSTVAGHHGHGIAGHRLDVRNSTISGNLRAGLKGGNSSGQVNTTDASSSREMGRPST